MVHKFKKKKNPNQFGMLKLQQWSNLGYNPIRFCDEIHLCHTFSCGFRIKSISLGA